MKKLLSIFSIVALTLILVFPADASIDARERPNGASFHIKNVVDYALMGQGDRFLVPVIQLITFDEMGHCTRPRVPFLLNMMRPRNNVN